MKPAGAWGGLALLMVTCIAPGGRADESAPAASPVSAASVLECQSQHERAKLLELEEKWFEARAAMSRCAVPSCPLALRSDCALWLEQLAQLLPTFLLVIERDDDAKGQVRVELDGQRLELSEPPTPIEVVPGLHRLSVSLEGHPPIESQVSLDKGEKNRVVRVRFASSASVPAKTTPAPPPATSTSRPVPASTYVLASGALVAFGVATALLVSAMTSLEDARQRCAPVCSSQERASIDRRLLFADVAGGVGIVLGGLAGYTFVTRPIASDSAGIASPPGVKAKAGFSVSLQGRF
jgi:hypothetical protein